jgi:hypothetical protein
MLVKIVISFLNMECEHHYIFCRYMPDYMGNQSVLKRHLACHVILVKEIKITLTYGF